MTWHRIQHRLEETFFLCVLVSPLAFVLATAIGLASWVWAGSDFGFFAAGFSWILAMTVFPAWLRVTWGPDTRIICQHCIASGNASLSQRSRIERRREGRSQVDGRGTIFKGREETFAVVSDLSKRGCRVKAASDLSIGECGQILIDLPGIAHIKVSEAAVRWATTDECGIEFLHAETADNCAFERVTPGPMFLAAEQKQYDHLLSSKATVTMPR